VIDSVIGRKMNKNKAEDNFLIVIDNILSVTEYSDHPSSWNAIFKWVKNMRDNGATIIFVHHTNTAGRQRGSGIKTAVVDNVIRVNKRDSLKSIDLTLTFEKKRSLPPTAQTMFMLSLSPSRKTPCWIDHSEGKKKDIETLKNILSNIADSDFDWKAISERTGYGRGTIYKYRARLNIEKSKESDSRI